MHFDFLFCGTTSQVEHAREHNRIYTFENEVLIMTGRI